MENLGYWDKQQKKKYKSMNCRMKRAWYEHESVPQTGVSCVLEEKRVKIFLFFLVTNENEENRALMKVVSCSTEKKMWEAHEKYFQCLLAVHGCWAIWVSLARSTEKNF